METAGATGKTVPPAVLRNSRRSSAMSRAVLYRSVARFESALRQIRSSSLGIVSSIWRGGRASVVAIISSSSLRASSSSGALAEKGRLPVILLYLAVDWI